MPFTTRIDWKNEIENLSKLSFEGKTLIAIGEIYGVSKQRIKQIMDKYKVPQIGLKRKAIEANLVHFKKWGVRECTDLYSVQKAKFRNKKARAVASGIDFTISFGELIWPKDCPILGMELDYFAEGIQENSVSFDKIDPRLGYIAGNVHIISWRANRIKNDGSAEEHRSIAAYLDKITK